MTENIFVILFIGIMTSLSHASRLSCTTVRPQITRSPGIQCWASCSLGNCAYKPTKSEDIVSCSWEFQSPIMIRKYNYSLILNYVREKCLPNRTECDNNIGSCVSIFHLHDCFHGSLSLTSSINAWLRVKGNDGDQCEDVHPLQICFHAKPDEPKITGIGLNNSSRLNIEIVKPSCSDYQLRYQIQYNWANGERSGAKTTIVDEKKTYIIGREATEYNITVRSTTHLYVFSSPVYIHHTTKPRKALDKKSLRFRCSKYHGKEKTVNVSMSWKKAGIIDYFNINIFDENKEQLLSNKTTRPKRGKTQQKIEILSLELSKRYYIEITAQNNGGSSQPAKFYFEKEKCKPPAELHCSLLKKDKSWIAVQWDIDDEDDLYKYDVKLQRYNDVIDRTEELKTNIRTWNWTNLEECIRYKITVCSIFSGVEQSCRHINQFTNATVPKSSPRYQLNGVTSRRIDIRLTTEGIKDEKLCGRIQSFIVKYWKVEDSKQIGNNKRLKSGAQDQFFSLSDLTPNTEYAITLAMENEAGFGTEKIIHVFTREDAPDNPPEIRHVARASKDSINISWKPPRTPNGRITTYQVLFKTRGNTEEYNSKNENCSPQNNSILCDYNGTNTSVQLGSEQAGIIHVRACTGNNPHRMCSEWSDPAMEVGTYDESGSLLLIILCIVCGIMVVFVMVLGIIYRCREQGPKPMKPWMHPVILREFEKDLLPNKVKDEEAKNKSKKYRKG